MRRPKTLDLEGVDRRLTGVHGPLSQRCGERDRVRGISLDVMRWGEATVEPTAPPGDPES
jgi:hypothetical protein